MERPSDSPSAAAIVLALAVPFVFLHVHYQPHIAVGQVDADLSDFAILAAVAAAAWAGLRDGFAPLQGYRTLWLPLAAFALLLLASLGWAAHADPHYDVRAHLVSALKFVEYMLLAPAVPLALRRDLERRAFFRVAIVWSAFLTLVAVLQFLGVLVEFEGYRPEQREPSYIGIHDLGAFSGAALSIGFASILLETRRRSGGAATVAGGLGIAIAAALDSVGGMILTAVVGAGIAWRRARVPLPRLAAIAGLCALIAVAAVTLRGPALRSFFRFLGIEPATQQEKNHIQTYAQRTVLAYIGFEIWIHHPLVGVGWQESAKPHSFRPYLADAHARFRNAAPQSFPSTLHPWGVQNGIVQTLSDLGIVGGLLLLAAVLATARLVVRVGGRGPPELLWGAIAVAGWLCFAVAVFTGTGLLPGLPVDAQLWLSMGLAVSLHNSLAPRR